MLTWDKYRFLGRACCDISLRRYDTALLYYILERFQDDVGYVECSHTKMIKDLGIYKTGLWECLNRLAQKGYILYTPGTAQTKSRFIPLLPKRIKHP